MERKCIISFAFAVLALTLISVPVASAKALETSTTMAYDVYSEAGPNHPGEYGYWKGVITGGIAGTIYFWETARNYIVGKTEHFFEDFYIDLGDGWVSGYDDGIWNFATFKFRAYGRIMDASENYAYLIGDFFFEQGTTSDPNAGLPITGTATGFIAP